jgi:hypothetical protein
VHKPAANRIAAHWSDTLKRPESSKEPTNVVEIVDSYTPGTDELPPFEFHVYPSPTDGRTVFGYLAPYGVLDSEVQRESWVSTRWGVPVHEAYEHVIDLAERFGVKVWVRDPLGLFPRSERRSSSESVICLPASL